MSRVHHRRVLPFPHVEHVALALSEAYGDPTHGNKMNPLRELLFIICSLQTNEALYQSTYASLMSRFPTFRQLAEASESDWRYPPMADIKNVPAAAAPPPAPTTAAGSLFALLEKSKKQIALALPRHLTPERMIRVAVTAVSKSPQLQKCSPMSIVACVIQSAELGLELSNPLGHAYMVPYWNKNTKETEAQFQIGYRGLLELAYRSGRVSTFCAHCVNENDAFSFEYGTKPTLKHKPSLGEPGNVTAVYAVVVYKDGGSDFEVMSATQINKHRDRYSKAWQNDKNGTSPWATAWEEMAKKTVIRRLAKRAPLSADIIQAVMADEYAEAGVGDVSSVIAAPPTERLSLRGQEIPPTPRSETNGHAEADQGDAPGSEDNGQHSDENPESDTPGPSKLEEDTEAICDAIERHKGDQAELGRIWTQAEAMHNGQVFNALVVEKLKAAGYDPMAAPKRQGRKVMF